MIICNDVAKNNMFSSKTSYLKDMNILILHVFKVFFFFFNISSLKTDESDPWVLL